MIGGLPGKSFMFVEFEESGGVFQLAALAFCAVGLDFAELLQGFLELAGEPLAVHAEGGEGAVGVNDVEIDSRLIVWWVGGAVKEGGFELRDAVYAPGCVGEFLSEMRLGGGGGLVFVEKLAAVALVFGGVLGGDDWGAAGEAVAEGILGRTLFAGGGAGSCGEECVGTVGASASNWG